MLYKVTQCLCVKMLYKVNYNLNVSIPHVLLSEHNLETDF
jgi:hypothetical protein